MCRFRLIYFFALLLDAAYGWSLNRYPLVRGRARVAHQSKGDDAVDGAADDTGIFASLRARQDDVLKQEAEIKARWRKGECDSHVGLAINAYVRRLAMNYPLAAVGTNTGAVVVAKISAGAGGELMGMAPNAHPGYVEDQELELALLHGEYDGNGVTAIAMPTATKILSGGRDKMVKVWSLPDKKGDSLKLEAVLPCKAIPSAIVADGPRVWVGCLDGSIKLWEQKNGTMGSKPLVFDAGSPVLCLSLKDDLIACGTSDGAVIVMREADFGAQTSSAERWHPWVKENDDGYGARTRAVAIEHGAVRAGSNEGDIKRRWIDSTVFDLAPKRKDAGSENGRRQCIFDESRDEEALLPGHKGAVVDFAARDGGFLISGAHDSTLRVWKVDVPESEGGPKCLYGFGGYKVWLGSVVCDGLRLVSDGSDNTVLVHDFSLPSNEEKPTK